jgi:CHAT domain-containing protein
VYVVPDGELHRVAFDSLLAGEGADRHFLVEDMVLATAIRAGGLERSRDPDPKMALLVGDATPLPPALPESVKFPRLASAAVEMDRIPASLPGTTASQLRGAAAVPAAYSASQPGRYSLLHFSAHAVPNELRPLQSAIILSDSPRGYRLQASEVAAVRIDSTELVTLSACHSAGARSYSGEGLVGFAWAFLGAGARHVVAGLWDVTDNLMPDFMADFYTQVGRRTPIPESLRQAKLSLMRRARKPYYWAPMQAFVR